MKMSYKTVIGRVQDECVCSGLIYRRFNSQFLKEPPRPGPFLHKFVEEREIRSRQKARCAGNKSLLRLAVFEKGLKLGRVGAPEADELGKNLKRLGI